jgi:hypothetical protein
MQQMESSSWTAFKSLIAAKGLLIQYTQGINTYEIFGSEANAFMWHYSLLMDNGPDQIDFEANFKDTANQPLEYRTVDGLPKMASSRFVESLSFFVDGYTLTSSLANNTDAFAKKHYTIPVSICGADIRWNNGELGDYVDLEVGIYMVPGDEASFYTIGRYSDHFNLLGSGNRIFDVPAVKTLPSQVPFPDGNTYDTYVRAHVVHANNVGINNLEIALNFLMWR